MLTERGVLLYQPSWHYCLHLKIIFKFIAVKIWIHQWKTPNTQRATEFSDIIPNCVDPSITLGNKISLFLAQEGTYRILIELLTLNSNM